MITLHRHPDDQAASKIEEKLQDLVVAYRVEEYEKESLQPKDTKLPFITENSRTISGRKEIQDYLTQLSIELGQQRQVSGDGCYLDPDTGKVC